MHAGKTCGGSLAGTVFPSERVFFHNGRDSISVRETFLFTTIDLTIYNTEGYNTEGYCGKE
jgi:hypothetical protein